MIGKILLCLGLLVSTAAQADLVTDFQSLGSHRKGPFTINYLQGTRSRIAVTSGMPAGTLLFQAAFRNDIARKLAVENDFYVGNLFTTNYYELTGEFVYGDAYGSHELQPETLIYQGELAFPKASSMVRHWVLEGHYIEHFPSSPLARAFKIRGISGSEFEQAYAVHFLNFYLSVLQQEEQFLPAFLLAKGSPIAGSPSLERARVLIASEYDRFKEWYGENDSRTRRLYQLRNAVHNQLSQNVIREIDLYLRDFPEYRQQGRRALLDVRDILVAYYSVSVKRVAELAKKAGLLELAAEAESIQKTGATVESSLRLSEEIAVVRSSLTGEAGIRMDRKADSMAALLTASQYLNKELLNLKAVKSKDSILTMLNLIYAEGYLIADNWKYFANEVRNAPSVSAAGTHLADVVGIAGDSLAQAFAPSLDQWIQVEPKMNYFIDTTIKSSALNTASVLSQRITE